MDRHKLFVYMKKINSICKEDGDQPSVSLWLQNKRMLKDAAKGLGKILKVSPFASPHISTYIENSWLVPRCVCRLTEGKEEHHDKWDCVLQAPNKWLSRILKFGSIL